MDTAENQPCLTKYGCFQQCADTIGTFNRTLNVRVFKLPSADADQLMLRASTETYSAQRFDPENHLDTLPAHVLLDEITALN
jgi:hypothetical protein